MYKKLFEAVLLIILSSYYSIVFFSSLRDYIIISYSNKRAHKDCLIEVYCLAIRNHSYQISTRKEGDIGVVFFNAILIAV